MWNSSRNIWSFVTRPRIRTRSPRRRASRSNACRALGLLDAAAATTLTRAVSLYQGLIQLLRLAIDSDFDPADAPRGLVELLLRAGELPDMKQLEALLAETRANTRALFVSLLGA